MPSNIQPIFKFSQLLQNVIQFLLIRKLFSWNMICTHFYMCECKAWWIIQKWILLCKPVLFLQKSGLSQVSVMSVGYPVSLVLCILEYPSCHFLSFSMSLWRDKCSWLLHSSFPPISFPPLLLLLLFLPPLRLLFHFLLFLLFLLSLLWKISNILLMREIQPPPPHAHCPAARGQAHLICPLTISPLPCHCVGFT